DSWMLPPRRSALLHEHVDHLEVGVARAMQPRAGDRELAQMSDRSIGNALAREQLRHARWVARDRLARDPAYRCGDGHLLSLAEEGLARRHGHLAEQHLRRAVDGGGRA